MKFRKIWLSLLFIINLVIISVFIYFGTLDGDLRLIGGILTYAITIVSWIIVGTFLFKMEEPVKKVNMANRYIDISSLELEKIGIDSEKYKSMIFEKFKIVHEAFSNSELDVLKSNVTLDLYNYYTDQLEMFRSLNRRNVVKDIELINIRIYEANPKLKSVKAYLNVKMYDYMIDLDTLKCVYGSDKEKRDLEFEIDFEIRTEVNGAYNQYVISRKNCINDMDVKK